MVDGTAPDGGAVSMGSPATGIAKGSVLNEHLCLTVRYRRTIEEAQEESPPRGSEARRGRRPIITIAPCTLCSSTTPIRTPLISHRSIASRWRSTDAARALLPRFVDATELHESIPATRDQLSLRNFEYVDAFYQWSSIHGSSGDRGYHGRRRS